MANFGERLRAIRKEKLLNQKELADIMGVSQVFISQYENGSRKPKPETIRRFQEALGCSFEDLGYKLDFWGNIDISEHDKLTNDILEAMEELNDDGKRKVLDYIRDIINNPNYIKRDLPKI